MNAAEATALAAQACGYWPDTVGAPRLVMQRENIVFQVDTAKGPCALRLHRLGYHDAESIGSELQWLEMLAGNGFTVPSPRHSTSGSFLVTCVDANGRARMFSMLTWLPGVPFGASALPLALEGARRGAVMAEIGRSLARLHMLSDGWSRPQGFKRPAWDHAGLLGETPFWGRFWEAGFLTAAERAWLVALRATCQEALQQYDAQHADYGLIHADLARENVLIQGDTVAFIDFDDSGFGYRMFDMATALIKNIYEPDYEQLKHALLAGYTEVRPLAPQDAAALPLAMLLRSLTYLGWVDARLSEPGMAEKARRFLADVKYLAGGMAG
jgi:Ser/Thr protein kinase RdoA (MazF antagonist)